MIIILEGIMGEVDAVGRLAIRTSYTFTGWKPRFISILLLHITHSPKGQMFSIDFTRPRAAGLSLGVCFRTMFRDVEGLLGHASGSLASLISYPVSFVIGSIVTGREEEELEADR
jgi:hypothetical protein